MSVIAILYYTVVMTTGMRLLLEAAGRVDEREKAKRVRLEEDLIDAMQRLLVVGVSKRGKHMCKRAKKATRRFPSCCSLPFRILLLYMHYRILQRL